VDDDEDHGARGMFSGRANEQSWQLKVNKHLKELLLGVLAIVTGALFLRSRHGSGEEDGEDDSRR
jgi:hypothetical protein